MVTYSEIQDRIQYLGYRSTFADFTQTEEQELCRLLSERDGYEEYQRDQERSKFFLSLLG